MDDWKIIWNSFCDEVAESVKKKNLEKVFEENIARDFFTTLGWNRFKKELKEQYPIKFATATHKSDFALNSRWDRYCLKNQILKSTNRTF